MLIVKRHGGSVPEAPYNNQMIIPVILSGGAGTRLWLVSRVGHPKPFMKLAYGEKLVLAADRLIEDQ